MTALRLETVALRCESLPQLGRTHGREAHDQHAQLELPEDATELRTTEQRQVVVQHRNEVLVVLFVLPQHAVGVREAAVRI